MAEYLPTSESEPSVEALITALRDGGVDSEILADINQLPLDEAIGAAYTALLEVGEDPDEFLQRAGIIE